MLAYLRRAARRTRDKGASAVEYGLMVAAISALIVGVVFGLGGFIRGAFQHTCEELAKHPGNGACTDTTGGGAPAPLPPPRDLTARAGYVHGHARTSHRGSRREPSRPSTNRRRGLAGAHGARSSR
jgi:pilus assembly protein Flp/PilA